MMIKKHDKYKLDDYDCECNDGSNDNGHDDKCNADNNGEGDDYEC